ncbi:MAG: hypothetical protein RIR45_1900 [Pseudomonadota bacterium]
MKHRLLRNRLSAKLSLLVTLTILLVVLALGVNFEAFLRQSFLESTRVRMQHTFERLDANLGQIESDLKVGVAFASQEESLVASIELINQYQDKANYNEALIDEEKKTLALEVLERVKYSQNSGMLIYDQNDELLAFAGQQAGVYQLGYLTFASGQPLVMVRTASEREFLPGALPKDGTLGGLRMAHTQAEEDSNTPTASTQRLGDWLIIKGHQNVFDPVRQKKLGHIEVLHNLDSVYFERLSKDIDIKLTHAFESPQAAQALELGRQDSIAALVVSEAADHYIGVSRKNTLSDTVYFTVMLDKSLENAAVNSQRVQILLTLLALGGGMLVLMQFAFTRMLARPLNQLMAQIHQIKHGNYAESPQPATGDELEEIGRNVNTLAGALAQREAELTDSAQKTKALAKSLYEAQQIAQLGSWTLDVPTGKLQWSTEIYRLFELDPLQFEASYEAFLNAIHPDDRAEVNRAYTQSLEDRTSYQTEHRLCMPDGRIKWVSERCRSEFDASGRPLRSIGTVQDITERKLAELALAETLNLLNTVVDSIPMRVFWKDAQLNYLGCNTVFAHDAGHKIPADVIGKDDYQMGWVARADLYRADDRQVIDSGMVKLFFDEMQTTPDGQTIWLRTSKIPLKDQKGKVLGMLGLYEDITQRKESEDLVRKLSQVAEQSPENVLITDLTGCIEYVNAAFLQTTGYSRDEIIGKNPRLLHTGGTPRKTYEGMWQSLGQGQVWSGELLNQRKDGSDYAQWAVISPLRDAAGTVTHYVSVQEDITEKKRLAGELDQYRRGLEQLVELRTSELTTARRQADASNLAKSEFLANMSHEIRTPMNGVIGMADILAQTGLTPTQRRMVSTINSSSMALLSILNDILDFSKIEAGKLDIEHIATPLREVVESVAQLMLNMAQSKDVGISLFIDPGLPEWIFCDPTRLRQILLNLLGNALKFVSHESGHAKLRVQAATRPDGSTCLRLTVTDNGIGMAPDVLAKLFQPFTQADASTMRRYGGTGLGLSITQRLVEMLQGTISVESTPGVGSEFTVELPLQATVAPEGHAPRLLPDLHGVHVLAVSSSRSCQDLFQAYLGSVGVTVTDMPDLATARSHLAQATKDTVLLLDLSQASGIDNTLPQQLKLDTRVVRLVRRRTSGTEAHVIEVQARPMLYHDLLQGVALACKRITFEALAASTALASVGQHAAPDVETAAQLGQLILIAEDNETNRDVLREQLRLLGYACEVATDGAQALAMWREGQRGTSPRYALLLTDCHMPNMDGFELTAAIRQTEPGGTRLPIIAITANAMQGEAERCHDRGMDGYLCKPLRMGELGDMLHKWLPLALKPDASESPEPASGARENPMSVWDPHTLTRLIGTNPALHERLLKKFVVTARQQRNQIETAFAAGDLLALKQVAHNLKSAARSVGALLLGELCQGLEDAGTAHDQATCGTLVQTMAGALDSAVAQINQRLRQSANATERN